MNLFLRKIKIILLLAIILNASAVVIHGVSAYRSVDAFRSSMIGLGRTIIHSFESGNRVFRVYSQHSMESMRIFLQDLSRQESIRNFIIFDRNGKVLLSLGTIDQAYLMVNQNREELVVETEDLFYFYKPFNPIVPLVSPSRESDNIWRMHPRFHFEGDVPVQELTILLVLDKSNLNVLKHKQLFDMFQMIAVQIILLITFYYSIKLIKLYQISQERLRRAEKDAELGSFSNILAHEIRNPLSAMSGLIRFAIKKTPDGQVQEVLENALNETGRLNKIVEDFMAYGKDIPLETKSVNPAELAQRAAQIVYYDMQSKNITLQTHFANVVSDRQIDPEKLLQVLVNLLLNSIQGSPEGAPIELRVTEREILIINQIPEGTQIDKNKIFEPFYTTKSQGSGLGLAISKKIIEQHGFTLGVHSVNPFSIAICFEPQERS